MTTAPAVWYLMRATGVVALLLLTLSFALGIATSNRFRPRGLPLFVTTTVHRNASLLAVAFLAVHVGTAVIDPDASVGLAATVIPFAARVSTFWVGLGAVALDLIVALVATSLLRRHMSHAAWRTIHWAAYAAWPVAFAHGLGMGTDAATPWLSAVNAACLAALGGAVAWRLLAVDGTVPRSAA
jgi:sulfoxide reductase heme-binding subunit YedZ